MICYDFSISEIESKLSSTLSEISNLEITFANLEFELDMKKTASFDIVKILEELVAEYNSLDESSPTRKEKWRTLVATLPCGFCLGATMTTNYQQLKTMYYQRRTHKLEEWKIFCTWCESLPGFIEFITTK